MKASILSLLFLFTTVAQIIDAQTVAAAPTSYYRLRFSFNTTSDWAALETSDPRVLLSRQISSQGSPIVYSLKTGQILMGQPFSAAKAGTAVGVLVDYAISPADLGTKPLNFTIRGGSLNNSWAAIWNVTAQGTSFLQLADTLTMAGNGSWNFTINTAALAKLPMAQVASWQTPAVQKMAWAFYYPWYPYLDNWNDSHLQDWPSQLYASGDTAAIQRQILQAKSAGLDGFISSWSGPGSWTDTFLRPVLDTAQSQNFAITPYFETLDDNGNPHSTNTIVSWLTYLLSTYGSHPAFYKVGGRPVVFVWSTQSVPLETWRGIFAQVRAKGLDAAFLSMGADTKDLSVFDGMHLYGYHGSEIAAYYPELKAQVKYYHLLADTWAPAQAKIWVPGVAPGYDETLLPGRSGRVQPRNGGAYYQSQWDVLAATNPDWVALTSWNEFYENTQLEPSRRYGLQYLQLTGANIARWKNQ